MHRRTSTLLLVLTAVAASTDAVSYLGLGQVFPANMTGNTVLLGIHLAQGQFVAAARSGVALGGFVLGAGFAGVVQAGLPSSTVVFRGLLTELAVLGAAAGWWIASGPLLFRSTQFGLVALAGVAMGLQSATVTRLHVGVSTTFITGTWTNVSSWVGSRLRPMATKPDDDDTTEEREHGRQALVLVCYFAFALATGYFHYQEGAWAAVLGPALLVCALGIRAWFPSRDAGRPARDAERPA